MSEWVSKWVSELVSEWVSEWVSKYMYCPTPATQKRRSPKGRQGVHQTLWQCTLSHACHAKCTLAHACHASEWVNEWVSEPQGTPGRTSNPLAVHIVPRLPRKSGGAPRDARAYIQPLGSAHCPTPATQKRRSPKGRQGVHPTPWQCTLSDACHAKAAEPQGTPGRTSNPLAVHIVPRLPRKMHIGPRLPREWVSEWMSEWVSVCVSEWECEWVSEWGVSEWVCEWVSVWVSEWEWVSGWLSGGRRREAAEGGYRTKNKNPTRQCGEKYKEKNKQHHENNKNKIQEKNTKHYKNKEKYCEKSSKYREENKEDRRQPQRE